MDDRKDRYGLLVRTAARKSPRQLSGIVLRKARNHLIPRIPVDIDKRYRRRIPDSLSTDLEAHSLDNQELRSAISNHESRRYRESCSEFADGLVTFLNRTRRVSSPSDISSESERFSELPRLWLIKSAAFEPFLWGVLGYKAPEECDEFADRVDSWLESYIRTETIGSQTGYLRGFWAPYAVSLRIITLSRYGAWKGGLTQEEKRFLYKNLLFLENNVEWDVGGNHLIENGAALVVGGCAFPEEGGRFVEKGLDVLRSTASTQFLDDGYHFERSPMYHLEVTERMISALSILSKREGASPKWLTQTVESACDFTEYLRSPDDRIPLLNDAAFGQAYRLETILAYASSIGIDASFQGNPAESDLYWFNTDETTLLFDAGDSGPEHQMAHTHNDPGTILIWKGNSRVITDTGVFDYQPGENRTVSRSVESHNTVQVGETEPVSYGGRFRMSGPITSRTTTATTDRVSAVTTQYEAGEYEPYQHRRTVYRDDEWLFVWDNVQTEVSTHISRLHAHPEISVRRDGKDIALVPKDCSELCVKPIRVEEVDIKTGSYFPRFGVEIERDVVEFRTSHQSFGYFVVDQDVDVEYEFESSSRIVAHINGQTRTLPHIEL